jgi:hypothetical protein
MARVKINLKDIQKLLSEAPAKAALTSKGKIAALVKEKILSLVAKGISPIEGNGRFPAYKPKNKKKPTYPDTVKNAFPSKRRRPVNLYLSGDFLKSLRSRGLNVNLIVVDFADEYGDTLELGHRQGANGQAKRPILPTARGESFTKVIRAAILKEYREAILRYLKR